MEWVSAWARATVWATLGAAPVWAVLTGLELAFPKHRRSPPLTYLRGMIYWLPVAAVIAGIALI
jgi:hypothetical protein